MKTPYIYLTVLLMALPVPGFAQDNSNRGRPVDTGWQVSVGAGTLLSPKYLGADDYNVSLVPSIRISKGDTFFASVEEGIGYTVIDTGGLRAGPLARIAFGRDEDGSGTFRVAGGGTNDLLGLGDIDTSVELGGFAELDLGKLTASARAGQAVSGHDGLVGQIGLRYKGRLQFNGPPVIYSFGPQIDFGDSDYTNAYFGVDAAQSLASGLPVYAADGGVTSYGVSGTAIIPLTDTIATTFIANYSRLAGDVADAPLVTERGSRDQVFIGTIVSYKFD